MYLYIHIARKKLSKVNDNTVVNQTHINIYTISKQTIQRKLYKT